MTSRRHWLCMNAMLLICLPVLGCGGDGIQRRVVVGTVIFEGDPIANGEIRFVPDSGPVSGAPIIAGKFEVKHKGGVPVGKNSVRITAYTSDANDSRLNQRDIAEIDAGAEYQFIPLQYNDETVLNVDVTNGNEPQVADFDLRRD